MKNQGITLVALVVTVIILLIIAGVAVSMITGNDGLFTKANEAGTLYNEEARKEAEWLQELMNTEYLGGTGGSGSSTGNDGNGSAGNGVNQNPLVNNGPLSNGSFDANKKVNSPDISQLPRDTTKYVIWKDNGNSTYSEQILITEPTNWYNYDNGQWANILSTGNGLKAYWVWIPRFAYRLAENANAKEIEVIFMKNDTKTGVLSDGTEVICYYPTDTEITANGSGLYKDATASAKGTDGQNKPWIIHPAFWWDNNSNGVRDDGEELNGFWMAKFEASNNGGKVEVKDGVASWISVTAAKSFDASRKMQAAGGVLGTEIPITNENASLNTHVAKNLEWAAVSILSLSKYGVYNPKSVTGLATNGGDGTLKVWNNPNTGHITGTVGTSADAVNVADTSCIRYNMKDGQKSSTTGTIYGVYDMAGCTWELVMGIMANATTTPTVPMTSSTGFSTWPNSKYYDIYIYSTSYSDYTRGKIGDLTSELKPAIINSLSSTWGNDYADFLDNKWPILYRGGYYANGTRAGATAFARNNGASAVELSFRPVMVLN